MSNKAIQIGLFDQKKFISVVRKNLFNFLNKKIQPSNQLEKDECSKDKYKTIILEKEQKVQEDSKSNPNPQIVKESRINNYFRDEIKNTMVD